MEIEVTRQHFFNGYTEGQMFVDGHTLCYTLEDKDRGLDSSLPLATNQALKVYGETAIPIGRYKIEKLWWPKHSRFAPHLVAVPAFQGILIHAGVTAADTLGCVLVGEGYFGQDKDSLLSNPTIRAKVEKVIFDEIDRGEDVYITIDREPVAWEQFKAAA